MAECARVELVVAVADNDVIGRGNRLPWRLPADLRHFKSLTLGHHVLMGRKTYESIGKALPGRMNLVLSRSREFAPDDCAVVRSVAEAQSAAGTGVLMVIGGAEIYRECLGAATTIHLTQVHAHIADGDTFFAGWRDAVWHETWREHHAADHDGGYAYSFVTLQRKSAAV
jgi:dihydrofolate reductase